MKQVVITKAQINPAALDAALRTALGAVYLGYSTRGGDVIVHLVNTATLAQTAQAGHIVRGHDPAVLTDEQEDALERQQLLADARAQNMALLDLLLFDLQPDIVKRLARKIYWLEQEIRDLRGLN